jgi:two-component system, NtrC family, nitrogen regulation sensor histidine kinase NtrY
MIYNNFRLNIIIRILLIFAFMILLAFWIINGHYLRSVYIGILIIVLIVELFIYTDRLNNNLSNFFSSLLSDDYSNRISDSGKGRSFRKLYEILNAINDKIKILSKEKETRSQYLGSLIEQSGVGILSIDLNGKIHLVNKAFQKLLGLDKAHQGMNLGDLSKELLDIVHKIPVGEHKLIRWVVANIEKPFSFQVSRFKLEEQLFILVSVHDIRAELDEKELEAWQKLIRVLTHEIMNSVTPIVSLSNSLYGILKSSDESMDEKKIKSRLSDGLEAIVDRSSGLMKFTTAYQNLTRIPTPKIQWIDPDLLLKKITTLYLPEMQRRNISFSIHYSGKPEKFRGDPDLLEQVLINLIRNAVEAVEGTDNPRISLNIEEIQGYQLRIKIEDNGQGMNKETMDKIFVPFFSTKKDGSGIGLSLSRQIVMMHKGSIEVTSKEGEGSIFEIFL